MSLTGSFGEPGSRSLRPWCAIAGINGKSARHDGNFGDRSSFYAFREGTILEGLSIGGGVRYVSSTFGDDDNTIRVPNYTVADAALRYKRGAWQAALNVTNLFDKSYFATCYPGEGCYYAEGRNITGSLTGKF